MIARCRPIINEKGELPDPEDITDAANDQMRDVELLWQSLACCSGLELRIDDVSADLSEPGMCSIIYADITVAFSGPPPDPATLTPLLDTLESGAPEEIAEQVGVMTTAARSVLDSNGEDFSAFEAPEFAEAQSEVDPYMFENCEFDEKVEVTAADYSFDGIPTELPAGRVAFLLTNEGSEPHEMALARKKDGVTESWDEILALPEDQAMEKIDQAGGAFAPGQGDQGLAIAELEAGEYVAVCFIPVGTSIDDTGEHPGDGPPHFTQGMKSEFTVA